MTPKINKDDFFHQLTSSFSKIECQSYHDKDIAADQQKVVAKAKAPAIANNTAQSKAKAYVTPARVTPVPGFKPLINGRLNEAWKPPASFFKKMKDLKATGDKIVTPDHNGSYFLPPVSLSWKMQKS